MNFQWGEDSGFLRSCWTGRAWHELSKRVTHVRTLNTVAAGDSYPAAVGLQANQAYHEISKVATSQEQGFELPIVTGCL